MRGTLIDTPDGPVPVEQVREGTTVWTLDGSGKRIAAPVVAVASAPVPDGSTVMKLTLSDGRSVTASPGHPTADRRALGGLRPGDVLDGATVLSAESIAYDGGATFDILPSGAAGVYWADGVLLGSTIAKR